MVASGSLFVVRGIIFYLYLFGFSYVWAKIKFIIMRIIAKIVYVGSIIMFANIVRSSIRINNNHFQTDISRYYIDIYSPSSFYTRDRPKIQLEIGISDVDVKPESN